MSGSCCQTEHKFEGASKGFKRALWAVIFINGGMFITEVIAGALSGSQALQADALDFLADTATYALSLYVIGMSIRARTTAALIKGFSLAGMGIWVLGSTVYQTFILGVPQAEIMGSIGFLALLANAISVLLLLRYRYGDANVRSVWLCSRNDAIGNVAVMIAAAIVWYTNSAWPDLIVAGLMAGLFLKSALQIVRQAVQEYRAAAISPSLAS